MGNNAAAKSFHGWRIVALATFAQFVAVGFTSYLIGLYIEPLSVAFSATPGQLGWASSIFMLVVTGLGPVLGYWVDKGKVRLIMTGGAIALATGMMLLSQAVNVLQGALICAFLIAPGASMLSILPAGALLVQWFVRRRGLVMGIAAAGMSLGGFAMPPIAAWLFSHFGWRPSTLGMGLFVAVVLLPAVWLLVVSKPAELGQYPDGDTSPPVASPGNQMQAATGFRELFGRRDFWFIAATIGTINFASIMIITYLVPYARSAGFDIQQSALLISVYAGFAFLGKFVAGWLADRFQPTRILSGITLAMTMGLLPMVLLKEAMFIPISIAIVGLAVGGMLPVWSSLIALNFGPQAFGRVQGTMALLLGGVTVIPGPLGGYIFDVYGSYALAFKLLIGVLIAGFVFTFLIPRRLILPSVMAVDSSK